MKQHETKLIRDFFIAVLRYDGRKFRCESPHYQIHWSTDSNRLIIGGRPYRPAYLLKMMDHDTALLDEILMWSVRATRDIFNELATERAEQLRALSIFGTERQIEALLEVVSK